ncbi:MAG: extracellular solute-binding protein, partial [Spirochaetota bacterium]
MDKGKKIFGATVVLLFIFTLQIVWAGGRKEAPEKKATEVPAGKWTLQDAAKPWAGQTLRFIGESLPPLEALDKVKAEFEKETGVKVIIEQYGHEEVVEKTMADFVGKTRIYDLIISPHREIGRYVVNDWLLPIEPFMEDTKLHDPDFNLEAGKAFINEWYWHEASWYKDTAYGLPFHFISMYL